jgi:hypothetical protein
MPDSAVHLHREQARPVAPVSIAACHATVAVLLDGRDTAALRVILAGCAEVRLIRITRRPGEQRARAEIECLAGSAEQVVERLAAQVHGGAIGPLSAYVRRGASA